jgi:hypothetical protein
MCGWLSKSEGENAKHRRPIFQSDAGEALLILYMQPLISNKLNHICVVSLSSRWVGFECSKRKIVLNAVFFTSSNEILSRSGDLRRYTSLDFFKGVIGIA